MKLNSNNNNSINKLFKFLSFDNTYSLDEEYIEDEYELDKTLRKNISEKIINHGRLTNEEYVKLLEYAIEEYKKVFKLEHNGKKYEMVFKEVVPPNLNIKIIKENENKTEEKEY